MLQVLDLNVSNVDRDIGHVAWCFKCVPNVSSVLGYVVNVLSGCCKNRYDVAHVVVGPICRILLEVIGHTQGRSRSERPDASVQIRHPSTLAAPCRLDIKILSLSSIFDFSLAKIKKMRLLFGICTIYRKVIRKLKVKLTL
jgi:hypothetical protein